MEEYINKIKEIIATKTGLETSEIPNDADFTDDLNVSEIEFLEIQQELEEIYDVDLEQDLEEITAETVNDLAQMIFEKVEL